MESDVRDLPAARAGRREWWGPAVLALPTLLLSIDLSVLFLALPGVAADLGASGTEQLWIVDVCGLLVAGCLVTMGTLGDRMGRRRLLLTGAACFGGASVLAAYAPSAELLIAARALLGVAGATLAPATLVLITHMFRDAGQRAVAVTVWSGCFMGGAVLGPIVGGLLLARFWWGSVFLLAVPVMAVLLAAGSAPLPEYHSPAAGRLDPVSAGLSLAAVIPVVYGVKEFGRGGGQTAAAVAVVVGVVFGGLFVRRQHRLTDPMLDLGLFRIRTYRDTLVLSLLVGALQGGGLLLVNMYLQLVAGLSALAAGLWLVPAAVAMLGSVALCTALARTRRPAHIIAAGMFCVALGYLVLSRVPADGGLAPAVAGMCLVMAGVGPMASLGYGLALGAAPNERAGSASATMEAGGQFGIAVGIGVLGSIASAVYRDRVMAPEGLSPEAAQDIRESLPGALAVADRLLGPSGADLLDSARVAFTGGLGTVAAGSAVVFVLLGVLAAVALRHVPPTGLAAADDADLDASG